MQLVNLAPKHLDAYRAALETGWSPRTTRPEAAGEELQAISNDPAAFLDRLGNPEGIGPDIELPDGIFVKRLPSFRRWIWHDGFCGSIELRWQHGTNALPLWLWLGQPNILLFLRQLSVDATPNSWKRL